MARRKIRTTINSHGYCFICRRKRSERIRPIQIKRNAVIDAFKNYRIIIKEDARCCKNHLNEFGLIKTDCFNLIRTELKSYNNQMIEMLDMLNPKQFTVLEKFNDMDSLEETDCLEITGWTKDQFNYFSKYITSINESKNRSKEQLIALYRYWLRTGTNQSILAKLFNKTTTQQEISNYLSQIRKAIYEDFVPFYLGANKNREFYLSHNNLMVSELLKLKNKELVIICDGTYKHIEKSANNEMQYRTWSVQKTSSLLKPFIICCADGYIIDCFEDFDANLNDAEILKYILGANERLKNDILLPNQTIIFIDREFRDIVKFLKEECKFDVKIPTCQQLEDESNSDEENSKSKQLTVKQANETRIVTKCRFIIEKKIGEIKKMCGLDVLRNSEIGHIAVDYRIACAMINFSHKPCCPDGKNAVKIAKRILNKGNEKSNKLEFLIKKQLDTKLINPIEISTVWDFPIIRKNKMKNKLFLGSYQLNQARSYVKDLIASKNCYIVSEKLIKKDSEQNFFSQFQNSKILAFELTSRHKRAKKKNFILDNSDYPKQFKNTYKVFIQYKPNINRTNAVKAYICNCMSGRKLVGCCSHVAAVIYYLSYLKYRLPGIHLRGEFLNNIPIDIKNNQSPNKPKIVRRKRNLKESSSDSELTESESEFSDSEATINNENRYNNINSQQYESNNEQIKNQKEELEEFKSHIPLWGASIRFKEKNNVFVTNTCTIDYFLLSFWFLFKKNENYFSNIISNEITTIIKDIITRIETKNWNVARELWINRIMKNDQLLKISKDHFQISMNGTEKDRFLNYLKVYQNHQKIQQCSLLCEQNKKVLNEESNEIFFKKINCKIHFYSPELVKCCECKSIITCDLKFGNVPSFIFIQAAKKNIFVHELPDEITCENNHYRLLCATIYKPGHYVGAFKIKNNLFLVDNLYQSVKILAPFLLEKKEEIKKKKRENYYYNKVFTSVCLYYLI